MDKKEITELIGDLIVAYVNKDAESPHKFEVDAITKACDYWLKYGGSKYSDHFMLGVKKQMEQED